MNGIEIFNGIIKKRLIDSKSFLKGRASYLPEFVKIGNQLKKQERIRADIFRDRNLTVPPILIISVTKKCNLSCRGCYDGVLCRDEEQELTLEEIDRIVGEGIEAGVGLVFFAGGEPLMKKGLLAIPEKYDSTLFVLFTNGLLINEEIRERLKIVKNCVPALSLEGGESRTDERRGPGVFSAVRRIMGEMDDEKLLFGSSLTLTRENYEEIVSPGYIGNLEEAGCRTLFLIEYVPCEGDPHLCLSEEQKTNLLERMKTLPREHSLLPVALPGDEEKFGGCLAAGRGFLHISSAGAVEACPFAPYSDVNLKELSFTEALESRLLGKIRKNHHLLEEAEGGCALFENREFVKKLARE